MNPEPSRRIDCLRISVTDRCNLRCLHCMPKEGLSPALAADILSLEEIARLARIFCGLGINKIRLTGGEPLIRRNILHLINSLAAIKNLDELSLTTNGLLLSDYAAELKKSGIGRINISLNTLKKDRFKAISGADLFLNVMSGIEKAMEAGLSPVKINTVVMRGVNDDEIIDFVKFCSARGLILRFIEFMKVTPVWKEEYFLPIEEVKGACRKEFGLKKIEYPGNGPAEYYKAGSAVVGFIKTDSRNCRACGRLRLTSTGDLRSCLYETEGLPLKGLLRSGYSDSRIEEAVKPVLSIKQEINYLRWACGRVYMSCVGG